jgi:hypothetical protein
VPITHEPYVVRRIPQQEVTVRRLMLPMIALAIVACQPAAMELTDAQRAEVEQAVRQTVSDYLESWCTQEDLDGHMAYYADWAGAPFAGFESVEAIQAFAVSTWELWHTETFELGEVDVKVLGPDAAAARGSYYVIEDSLGVTRVRQDHDWTHLWVREAGQWKLLLAKVESRRTDL